MEKANPNGLYPSVPLPLCSFNRKYQQEIRGRDDSGLGHSFSQIPSSRSLAGWLHPLTGWHSSDMWHSPNTSLWLWVFTTFSPLFPMVGLVLEIAATGPEILHYLLWLPYNLARAFINNPLFSQLLKLFSPPSVTCWGPDQYRALLNN